MLPASPTRPPNCVCWLASINYEELPDAPIYQYIYHDEDGYPTFALTQWLRAQGARVLAWMSLNGL